jgi:hypothetical protein
MPQYNNNKPPRRNQEWNNSRHSPQQSVPNTLAPTDMINQEGIPWCNYCDELHKRDGFPLNQGCEE